MDNRIDEREMLSRVVSTLMLTRYELWTQRSDVVIEKEGPSKTLKPMREVEALRDASGDAERCDRIMSSKIKITSEKESEQQMEY